jgi:NAD(P)-dependent dehydrogenase (short-subunit alcohol dehydrogenase family)
MRGWTTNDMPELFDRTVVVTGANTGIGFEIASALADCGAQVVLAVRNLDKGKDACARIAAGNPSANLELQRLDLASLASIRTAADELRSAYPNIDVLINNAGVLWTPKSVTADGFETQLGTNHLGHFALTGLLLERLLPVEGSRVVSMSSLDHHFGRINFDDLQLDRRYNKRAAYRQSKLANLMFSFELNRRLAAAGANTIAVAAHPGMSSSELTRNTPGPVTVVLNALRPLLNQSAAMGALPALRAATDPRVRGGQYYGPGKLLETRGEPTPARPSARARDESAQRRLWSMSEQLTEVIYPV